MWMRICLLIAALWPLPLALPFAPKAINNIGRFLLILRSSTATVPLIESGRVANVPEWIRWSSDSLERAHGISLWNAVGVTTWEEIDQSERYAVLSHGTQEDPIYLYANQAALKAFGRDQDEMFALPSRYSAPAHERPRRQITMDKKDDGSNIWIMEYGIRQRKNGSLFEIRDVWLWNVYNDQGERVGQSALYDRNKVVDYEA